jgi:hypothetical protein
MALLLPSPCGMTQPCSPNRFERWLGRWLARCVHPFVAWRLSSRGGRAGIVAGYATAAYAAGILACLLLL